MKKSLLSLSLIALTGFNGFFSQTIIIPQTTTKKIAPANAAHANELMTPGRNCLTPVPDEAWDLAFNAMVEQFKQNQIANKTSTNTTYTIPVIVHVIHNGEAVGTGSNISSTQINSQITILNNDYMSAGLNNANCPAAFTSVKSNTGITWCMATKDEIGNVLAEPGIDRINRNTLSFTAPPYSNTGYIDGTIKPNTIWDPTLYCNIWVLNLGSSLLGYATFPAGTGLAGLTGVGTSSNDGVVIGYGYFGNTSSGFAPYNKGRTASHELGHWLGLRHINGDSNCGNDYCADTPTQDQLHGGCISSSTPYHVNVCGAGTSPNGEMTMNFMDYTDDNCMYMFTNDQTTRMNTALTNGTYRSGLTASSGTLCVGVGTQFTATEDKADVILFPNPASNTLSVSTTFKKENNVTIKIYSAIGEMVSSRQIANTLGGTYNFDISAISSGIYFVTLSSSEKTVTKRFIVDK
ncbi:MAG: T9SS type A sorting domain-containing protein [Bacteroidia bacterium]|nr:T9SS type A sorting domain-containing protein [Bacteroidia bacterium]